MSDASSAFDCDVLIVGAGPAGADLARRLAVAGCSVLLVDSLPDLAQAAFSSAALPWSTVQRHRLPAQVVAARWNSWLLLGPGTDRREWSGRGREPLGAVLDFGALRHWLAEGATAAGRGSGWAGAPLPGRPARAAPTPSCADPVGSSVAFTAAGWWMPAVSGVPCWGTDGGDRTSGLRQWCGVVAEAERAAVGPLG